MIELVQFSCKQLLRRHYCRHQLNVDSVLFNSGVDVANCISLELFFFQL